jgi:hypothetical protein
MRHVATGSSRHLTVALLVAAGMIALACSGRAPPSVGSAASPEPAASSASSAPPPAAAELGAAVARHGESGEVGTTAAAAGSCPPGTVDCGDETWCCPSETPLCCGNGKCCPSGRPWACPSQGKCYENEEEAQANCDAILMYCR